MNYGRLKKIFAFGDFERDQWVAREARQIPKGALVLDVGAGNCRYHALFSHCVYKTHDFAKLSKELTGGGYGKLDYVSDICSIPVEDESFDAVLCTEVLEHVPNPVKAIEEFARLLKPGGKLILTAPFFSLVHFAPYHYCTGFSRYWYEYQLVRHGFSIEELMPNGDWFSCCQQELMRLGSMARRYGDWSWPFGYMLGILGALYFKVRSGRLADEMACFGWQCTAVKRTI